MCYRNDDSIESEASCNDSMAPYDGFRAGRQSY